MQRKGWFIIPGVQDGDRTLEEQMTGVRPALAECAGKTVLDLGCAEGLIGREFARAGAASVHGIESLEAHLAVAREQCKGLPMTFQQAYLNELVPPLLERGDLRQFDIVLSLGVCHKLQYPAQGIEFSARSARDLCLIRFSARPEAQDGILRGKHYKHNTCHVPQTMQRLGFRLEKTEAGPREETVQYWRRTAA